MRIFQNINPVYENNFTTLAIFSKGSWTIIPNSILEHSYSFTYNILFSIEYWTLISLNPLVLHMYLETHKRELTASSMFEERWDCTLKHYLLYTRDIFAIRRNKISLGLDLFLKLKRDSHIFSFSLMSLFKNILLENVTFILWDLLDLLSLSTMSL